MSEPTIALKPGLYVTATPIGNLGDITYRAVETLKNVDLILCEDARQTAKLCAAYSVATPREAYHEHNAKRMRPPLLKKLQDGARIALVSDAGTPLIADPGYKLVAEARALGIDVVPIPGASAIIAALSAAGAPTDRFTFAGFPPAKAGARQTFFANLATAPGTLVFYEAPSRVGDSLAALARAFGADRKAVLARELTKIHETIIAGPLGDLAAQIAQHPVKGEIVIIVEPAEAVEITEADLDRFLIAALDEMSVRDAAAAAAETLNIEKRRAYARALELRDAL